MNNVGAENYEYLGTLLRELAPHSRVISSWGQQGALLLDYLNVVHQVRSLVSQQDPGVGYHLERLQPQLSGLCTRIHLLPVPTAMHRSGQTTISPNIRGVPNHLASVALK